MALQYKLRLTRICISTSTLFNYIITLVTFPMALRIILPFIFALAVNAQWDPHFSPGRHTIVHLFEWKWNNIADECERFLGPRGYGGVQTSPANENVLQLIPFRPWSERYTPVSYKLITRSGTEEEFISMVQRCNAVGVRIYVDVVINHMTGSGSCCIGTGNSSFDATNKIYPAVPYGPEDFHTHGIDCLSEDGQIHDYWDIDEVKNCELGTLRDLNQGRPHVRDMIVEYLNRLISYGVAGFRVDASKYMRPEDLEAIFGRMNNLNVAAGFPAGARPFIVMEVFDTGTDIVSSTQYFHLGRTTEFKHGMFLGDVFRGFTPLRNLVNFGEEWGMYPSDKILVFIDNHDTQRYQGFNDKNILTFRDSKLYRLAVAFMQAWPHGLKRVMSSYYWETDWQDGVDRNNWIGPPNTNGNTNDVIINPDLTCGGGWICEHRWREIFNMVEFGNVVAGTEVTEWWDNGNSQIAFCRGNKGFVAINNEDIPLNKFLKTCLPQGTYCDVVSGSLYNGTCSGRSIYVDSIGLAVISIPNDMEVPMIAIHIQSKLEE